MAAKKSAKAERSPKKPGKGVAHGGDGKKGVESKKALDEKQDKKQARKQARKDTSKRELKKDKKKDELGKPAKVVSVAVKAAMPKQATKKGPAAKVPQAPSKSQMGRGGKGAKAAPAAKKAARGAQAVGGAGPPGRKRKPGSRGARRHSELTPKIITRLRQKLLDKHRDLVGAVTSSKGDSREQATDGTEDYIDYAVSSYDREFLLSLTELEQRELRRVEEALRRIDQGDYGFCQASGEEIPLKRLEAQPWARYCLRVQELEDQGLLDQDDFDTPGDGEEEAVDELDTEADEDEEAEEEEEEIEYRDEIPGDDGLSDPDAEERVV
jgi:DnaK suppressor protein